jgi:hypothetical protein
MATAGSERETAESKKDFLRKKHDYKVAMHPK